MTHPPTVATARVTLPASVIVCKCGSHHTVRGQRVRRGHCEWMLAGGRWR